MTGRGRRSHAELRRLAEERVEKRETDGAQRSPEDGRRLLHELEVHQIELEMQNEELQAARIEIEEGLERYTELFDFAPMGYVVLDPGGTIREANLEIARMLGVARKDFLTGGLRCSCIPKQRTSLAEFIARVLATGGQGQPSTTLEVDLPRGSDAALQVRLIASARTGAKPGVLFAVHDITARRRAERRCAKRVPRKDDFLATLSHELRNPLAPIRSNLAVVEHGEPGGATARAAMVDRSSGRSDTWSAWSTTCST